MELTQRDLRKMPGVGVTTTHKEQRVCNPYLWDKENKVQAHNSSSGCAQKCTQRFHDRQENRKTTGSCN